MNLIFVTLLATKLLLSSGYPTEGLVEIEKQRLVKFPEESFRIEDNEQKSSEAKRILEEINKINVALGYVKKQDQSLPSLLDANQFLFPKPAYHPFHTQSISDGILQPSIRNLNYFTHPYAYPSLSSKSIKSPDSKLFFYNYQQPDGNDFDEKPVNQYVLPKNENMLREFKLIDYKVVGDYQEPHDNKQKENLEPKLRLYFVPRQLNVNEKSMDYHKNEKLIKIEKLPTIRPFSKLSAEKQRPNTKPSLSNAQKYVSSTSTTTTLAPPTSALKTPFGAFFNRPNHMVTAQKIEAKPALQSVPLELPQYTQQQVRPDAVAIDNWDSDSSEENDYPEDNEKHIFGAKRKPEMAEVQKEALKESGIIIQRLKVRKGGIAIAGPGGVATAGSGGTAIVGPGGYALTHPRSLTIAGPGAKIIAIPESTDLKDVLQRTSSGRSYTDEGEVVATGPIVYYSPDDYSQISWQKTSNLNSWPQMPFYFPSTEFYNSPSISHSNIQLLSQTYNPFAMVDAVQQAHPWAASSDFVLNPYPYSYFYSSNAMPSLSNEYLKQQPTARPSNKFPEPTTRKPPRTSAIKSNKLSGKSSNDLKSDARLISAVQKVNPTFEIENIVAIPETPYFQIASVDKFPQKMSKIIKPNENTNKGFGNIKVEATGKTSAGNSVPDIPFGSYFLPYNSNIQTPEKKTASLILQPSSKAIVGNGGTAISAPISRAVLKKGVPTNVFFNPESVAIAGAGGRAHAQADLILDIME